MSRVFLAALLLFFVATALAWAHTHGAMQYDAWCCNGSTVTGDCQRIEPEAVKSVGDSYMVTLGPGDHRLATKPHVFMIRQTEARVSQDGDYHACLYPTEDTLRCFYAPPMGF